MKDTIRRPRLAWLALVLTLLTVARSAIAEPVRAEDAAAAQVVQGFNDTMMELLTSAEALGYKGRYDRLHPRLEKTFDLDFMAEKAVGRFWETLSPDERTRWRSTFSNFMCANYASRLNRFNNQKFVVVGSQAAANSTAIIQTKVSESGNEDVELSYRMRETPQGWRVIDVYYNGTVSELALRRADYAAVLKKDGFAGLIASVSQKIADMESGKSA